MLLAKETGATAKHINLKDIRNHPIPPLPSLEKQKRIADILSAYDDLIENNRRRIELLEQAARLIYKEWFVHLRFPGHENVPVVDGVPEGWTCQSLAELTTKIGSGATPKGGAAAYVSEGISLFRSQNIYNFRFTDEGLAYINDEQAAKLSAVEVEPLDILLNITGASVGRCCIAPEHHLPARVNQHVMIIRMRSSACGPHFALHTINSYRPKERLLRIGRAGGSTREALTKDNVKQIQVQIPPEELRQSFESIAGNLFEQGQILQQQNSNLAEARDLLLPRLMSGQIRV